MEQLGLPRILKNIWVQIEDARRLPEFEKMMDSLDNNINKWKEKGIKLYPFFLEQVGLRDLIKVNDNILEVDYYLEQVKDLYQYGSEYFSSFFSWLNLSQLHLI